MYAYVFVSVHVTVLQSLREADHACIAHTTHKHTRTARYFIQQMPNLIRPNNFCGMAVPGNRARSQFYSIK